MKAAINGATTMKYSIEEDIHFASQAGFDGIEIWWDKVEVYMKDHSAEDLKMELEKYEMSAIGICPFLVSPFRNTLELRETFQKALEVAEIIGCKLITVCPDFRPADMSIQNGLKQHGEEFSWYAVQAAKKGIGLAIEPIGGHTMIPGPMEALRLIELAGNPENMGIVLDTFHYMKSGVTEEEIMQIPKGKLYIVHINDTDAGMAEELQDKDRSYPFEGCIDLKEYKDMLHKIGYEGYCSVEVFRPEYWEEDISTINEKAFKSAKRFLTD